MSQPPENANPDTLKALWQGQEPETEIMTAQAIRLLVKESDESRRRALTCAFIVDAVVVGVVVYAAWTAPNTLIRVADLVMLIWAPLVLVYQLRRWPRRAPAPEATARELVEFRREQVIRGGPDLKLMGLALAPVGVSLVLLLIAVWEKASRMHPSPLWAFGGVIVAWAMMTAYQTRRHQQRTARQLRDLDALRR